MTLLNALRASQGGPPTSMENFLLGEFHRAIDECGICVAVIKLAARGDAQLRWDIKISHPSRRGVGDDIWIRLSQMLAMRPQ